MVESKTPAKPATQPKPLGDRPFSSTVPAYDPPKDEAKAEAKPEPKDKPWHPAFPPPSDGNYEVKWSDGEVVKANRRDGVWKLKDGRSIQIHEWR